MKIPLTAGATFNREQERAKNLFMKNFVDSLSIHHTADAIHAWTVTDWYEADQLPVRSGVYEVSMSGDGRFCVFRYFDGTHWYNGASTPDEALRAFQMTGLHAENVFRWRGLTEKAT